MGGTIMSFGPRTFITVLFLAVLATTGIALMALANQEENTNTAIAVGAAPADCVNAKAVTKPLSETITVQGEDGTVVTIRGLVFETCVAPGFSPDPQLLDTMFEVAKEVVYQAHNKDAQASSDENQLKTTYSVKFVAAEAAKKQIDQYVDYRGRIVIYVGTLPHTSEGFLTTKGTD